MTVTVKFWGTRGSIACPSADHMIYGGNTSCVEIRGEEGVQIILDAGTGIRSLGSDYLRKPRPAPTLLLLTHCHWDHINGFPFFAPAYRPGLKFLVMAGHLSDNGGVESVLSRQMSDPNFPVPLGAMRAEMIYRDFRAGETLVNPLPGVIIHTAPLNHPNGATGYRIETGGKVICLITDTEHIPGKPDMQVQKLMQGADLAIYDSTYDDAVFPTKIGWGHSTWQEGLRLAQAAGVKRLAIFHHDPDNDDTAMAGIEERARAQWSGALVARDNMEVVV